jgi:hypothetical protein
MYFHVAIITRRCVDRMAELFVCNCTPDVLQLELLAMGADWSKRAAPQAERSFNELAQTCMHCEVVEYDLGSTSEQLRQLHFEDVPCLTAQEDEGPPKPGQCVSEGHEVDKDDGHRDSLTALHNEDAPCGTAQSVGRRTT